MSTIGAVIAFTKTMATNATVATFNVGGNFTRHFLKIPSMASGGDIRFNASADGDTFKPLYHAPNVATSLPTLINIVSGISNCIVAIPPLTQHFQVAITTAATASAYEFTVICGV